MGSKCLAGNGSESKSSITARLPVKNGLQLSLKPKPSIALKSRFPCSNASTSSETVFSGSPTTTKSTSAFNRQSSGRDEGCKPNNTTTMSLLIVLAMDATSKAVFDQPENGISKTTTSGFHSPTRCAMVSALNPTRYLVWSSSKRFSQPSVGASIMLTTCFFSRTEATDAKLMGGKTLGFPHAFG